jgi:hypothetical protein
MRHAFGTLTATVPLKEKMAMSYSLFCTDAPTPSKRMPDHCRVVPVNPDSMGAAINEACKLIRDGVIVWKISGSDGFVMERSDIEIESLRRKQGALSV